MNGSARWRGTTTASWRKGRWSGGLSAYYIGSFADSGATTTAAVYQSLGRPSYIVQMFNAGSLVYRYRVSDSLTFNAFVGYRFGSGTNRWLRNSSVRAGVINLKDTKPPFSSGANGYSTSVYGTMLAGRTWTMELSKGL